MNYKDVRLTLNQLNIKPKKYLGQNFLTDKNIIRKIVARSEISNEDTILEIGPGLGALTESLVEKAKKVIVVEVDNNLSRYLSEVFSIYNNIEIINADILEVSLPKHDKVISNLPYKITGPILEKVFFMNNPPIGILTIEKSIGNRIFSSGNYKKFSRIGVTLNAFMKPIFCETISSRSFYPIPKIDIVLIKIIPHENLNPFLLEISARNFFLKFVAGTMPYKGKNIVNAISYYFKASGQSNFTKDKIFQILSKNGYDNKRLSNFNNNEIIEICKLFYS
jgi:16S rRNA (adenine1518-N6/adenine1519-N6)-dimethyltransferase